MLEQKYEVLIDNEVVATKMDINVATILLKALFEEYYNEHEMTISIREVERCEGCENVKR